MHDFLKRYVKWKIYLKAFTFLHYKNDSLGKTLIYILRKNGGAQSNQCLIYETRCLE